jgi:hypothetical protein
VIIDNKFVDRMATITGVLKEGEVVDEDGSIESRIALATAQFQMFRDHPWGTGHRGTEILSRQYLDESGCRARQPVKSASVRRTTPS